jgi:hypothetical protein
MRVIACLAPNRRAPRFTRGHGSGIITPYLVGDMMKVTRIVVVFAIWTGMGIGALHAQSLRGGQTPAEFPPTSYRGSQYIDSQGCVYIRAGIDGNVTWVPRVNRQRRLICGQTPTLSAEAAQSARTTPRASASTRGVEQITVPPSAQTATAAAPAPKPAPVRVTQQAAPAPKPAAAPRQVVTVAKPKPAPVVAAAPSVVARPTPAPKPAAAPVPTKTAAAVQTPRQPACQGASRISSRYINSGARAPVRCGPQTVARSTSTPLTRGVSPAPARTTFTTAASRPAAPAAAAISPQTRVVPSHVYDDRLDEGTFPVPDGYRSVWDDGRLNPRRAEQTLEGVARTRLIWTQTVPRRLIDKTTGKDVTASVPLVYPYTDTVTQQRELGAVTLVIRDGQLQKRLVRNKSKARAPTVSTRSAAAPVVTAKAKARQEPQPETAARYVQVGTYGQPANAQAAAQRILRAGLPARMGKLTRGGKSYQVVLAGPFTTSAALGQGLQKSRAAGFSDAFVR